MFTRGGGKWELNLGGGALVRGEGEHYWGGSEGRNVTKGTDGNGEFCRGGGGAYLEEKGRKKKSVLLRKVGIKKKGKYI